MTGIENTPFQPFFIDGSRGELFAVYFPPVGEEKGNYLCAPPFAEEMNRCRSMMTMQARALAQNGFGVMLLDLFGTGDSDGDFGDSDWNTWKQDLLVGVKWFETKNKKLTGLWGIRLGCLLASEIISQHAVQVERLIFWQPVTTGKTFLNQFLRIRIAAALDQAGNNETTTQMREQLAAGNQVEVGGYALNKGLTDPIDALKLDQQLPDKGVQIFWFELTKPDTDTLSIGSQKIIAGAADTDNPIKPLGFNGPAFWQLHERAEAKALIEQTTHCCSA